MANKNILFGLEGFIVLAALLIVAVMTIATMPITATAPEVEMGIEVNEGDWRIALDAENTFYGLEMYAPLYTGQSVTMECYDGNNLIREIEEVADEYGFVTFIVLLDTEKVMVT